ncbi:MAG: hypothetical protein HY047_05130 [Acidobacteria bacterium]|nr:hypothetical protein [Acidobacteriota bacterium]
MITVFPWERRLWSGGPWRLGRRIACERYLLTDVRLVRTTRGTPARIDELALDDIAEVRREESRVDRLLGTSTVIVYGRRHATPIVLTSVRRGAQLAALLELIGSDPYAPLDPDAVQAALAWEPRLPTGFLREALGGFVAVLLAIAGVAIGLHGRAIAVTYAPDDAIAPNGQKKPQAEIRRYMETDVMPWARATLGRIKGGPDRISCETCHGANADARNWQMPAVAALPQPDVRERGWEIYSAGMDAQMRNAIYGYVAESENQAKAGYMREVVVPGMARLLHRPAYDFTRSYEYNFARNALGCYHCHRVK